MPATFHVAVVNSTTKLSCCCCCWLLDVWNTNNLFGSQEKHFFKGGGKGPGKIYIFLPSFIHLFIYLVFVRVFDSVWPSLNFDVFYVQRIVKIVVRKFDYRLVYFKWHFRESFGVFFMLEMMWTSWIVRQISWNIKHLNGPCFHVQKWPIFCVFKKLWIFFKNVPHCLKMCNFNQSKPK